MTSIGESRPEANMASVGHFLLLATLAIMAPSPFPAEADGYAPPDGDEGTEESTVDPERSSDRD